MLFVFYQHDENWQSYLHYFLYLTVYLLFIFETTGIVILDALAATGLRTIRYIKEIPGVKRVVINDFLPEATAAAKTNVIRNGVSLDRSYCEVFFLYY